MGAGVRVDMGALGELGADLVAARLAVEVGHQDGPVEDLAVGQDVDAVAVAVERRHGVGELPHLLVLGVEDVRPVGLVEDALEVGGAHEAAGDRRALEHGGGHALAGQRVSERAPREPAADDEDAWRHRSLLSGPRPEHAHGASTLMTPILNIADVL